MYKVKMISGEFDIGYSGYRIKMIVAIEKDNVFSYRNELIVPVFYEDIEKAQEHITRDINKRLTESLYFRSQKRGFDLVRYANTAMSNTYIAYRIVPVTASQASKK